MLLMLLLLMLLLWHSDSSINHNHNHKHSRQSSFNQSIDRKSNSQIIIEQQTTNKQTTKSNIEWFDD